VLGLSNIHEEMHTAQAQLVLVAGMTQEFAHRLPTPHFQNYPACLFLAL